MLLFQIAERVKKLEDELADIKRLVKMEEDQNITIPTNYMNLSEFIERFKFTSGSQLSKMVRANEGFFKPVKIRRKVFIDPITVIDYVMRPPTPEESSVRVMNSFLKLRDEVDALRELYDKWKQHDAARVKLPEFWGEVK